MLDQAEKLKKFDQVVSDHHKESETIYEQFIKSTSETEKPNEIYHYTDGTGLHGILEKGEIWLHDVYSLNDPKEIDHLIDTAITHLPHIAKLDEKTAQFLSQGISQSHDAGIHQQSTSVFVVSFALRDDDLNQWRAYADDGRGYSLGFDAALLERTFLSGNSGGVSRGSSPVSYGDAAAEKLIDELVRNADSHIQSLKTAAGKPSKHATLRETQIFKQLISSLYRVSPYFKSDHYQSEREYRLIEAHPKSIECVGASVRTRPYKLIRYTRFPWKTLCPEALKCIISGPNGGMDSERFAHDVKNQYGLPNVKVVRSHISYRRQRSI